MTSAFSTYWRALAGGSRNGFKDRVLIMLLTPLSLAYALAQKLRASFYHMGILNTYRLPRPVISIGNITVGGTGKTPVTAYIARILMERGYKVAVLSRGYGGSLEGHTVVVSDGTTIMLTPRECGDEPFLLATKLPGLIVVMGSDRYNAGMLAMQRSAPDIFLLDDGFQHLRLHRDLNILLLDFLHPFGNGFTLPAGILREPSTASLRANITIFTHAPLETVTHPERNDIHCCISRHSIVDLLPLEGHPPVSFPELGNADVLAFAGIAEPDSFFEGLRLKGLHLVHTISFRDHAAYSSDDISRIADALKKCGAGYAITTEKDGVKLRGLWNASDGNILLARLEVAIENPDLLTDSALNLLQK